MEQSKEEMLTEAIEHEQGAPITYDDLPPAYAHPKSPWEEVKTARFWLEDTQMYIADTIRELELANERMELYQIQFETAMNRYEEWKAKNGKT